jgi:hypothetical protein
MQSRSPVPTRISSNCSQQIAVCSNHSRILRPTSVPRKHPEARRCNPSPGSGDVNTSCFSVTLQLLYVLVGNTLCLTGLGKNGTCCCRGSRGRRLWIRLRICPGPLGRWVLYQRRVLALVGKEHLGTPVGNKTTGLGCIF